MIMPVESQPMTRGGARTPSDTATTVAERAASPYSASSGTSGPPRTSELGADPVPVPLRCVRLVFRLAFGQAGFALVSDIVHAP